MCLRSSLLLLLLASCVHHPTPPPTTPRPVAEVPKEPPAAPRAIVHATIWTADAAGTRFEDGTVVMRNGRIVAVGRGVAVPPDAEVLDAKGRIVTPGLID